MCIYLVELCLSKIVAGVRRPDLERCLPGKLGLFADNNRENSSIRGDVKDKQMLFLQAVKVTAVTNYLFL